MTMSSTCSGAAADSSAEVRRERAEMATCCHGNGDRGRLGRVRMEEREGRREEGGTWRVKICQTKR